LTRRTSQAKVCATSVSQPHSLEFSEAGHPNSSEAMRSYLLTVCNYGVDHTGSILFEQVSLSETSSPHRRGSGRQSWAGPKLQVSYPFSAFACLNGDRRISLLPSSRSLLRILRMTMDGDNGFQRSQVFRIEDVSICEGGLESSPIKWEDGSKTGFFMYRTLADSYQSELHVIPEFVGVQCKQRTKGHHPTNRSRSFDQSQVKWLGFFPTRN
jgi:hypothetical protein